jgi:flagellar basal body-associated protein FliL
MYFSNNMIKPKAIDADLSLQGLIDQAYDKAKTTPVRLKKLTINLYARKTRLLFLDIELNVLPFSKNKKEFIKANEAMIADAVIEIAGDMSPSELTSISGKILLESRIREFVNQLFRDKIIKKIYFSRFVVE